jgi:glycosyl transferase family 25
MKIFIINLAQDVLRKRHMSTLMKSLELTYEFIDAIYGKCLPNIDDYVEKSKYKSIDLIGRELVRGEIGCILSHHVIYNRMIKNNLKMALILEDDIEVSFEIHRIIGNIEKLVCDWDVVLLGYHGTSSRENINLQGTYVGHIDHDYQIKQLSEVAYGTYGYIISLSGAKKILEQSSDFVLPIDHYTGNFLINNVYGVYPQLVAIKKELSDQSSLTVEREELRQQYKYKKVYKYYQLLRSTIDTRPLRQIILYGFNDLTKLIYTKYQHDIYAILDQQKHGQSYENMNIMTINELKMNNAVFIVCAINSNAIEEITNTILKYHKEATIISLLESKVGAS